MAFGRSFCLLDMVGRDNVLDGDATIVVLAVADSSRNSLIVASSQEIANVESDSHEALVQDIWSQTHNRRNRNEIVTLTIIVWKD